MSLQHLKQGNAPFQDTNSLIMLPRPHPVLQLSLSTLFPDMGMNQTKNPDVGYHLLNPPLKKQCKACKVTRPSSLDHNDVSGKSIKINEKKGIDLNAVNEEEEVHECVIAANGEEYNGKAGQTKSCVRGHWRPAEDAKLKELVAQYGPQNWNSIAAHLQGRSGKSCRLRWFNQLDPRINRKAFSEEEEERLLAAHRLYGNKWALIARLFPGRTDNAVKNHWHVIMARKQREQSNVCRKRKFPPPNFQLQLQSKRLDMTLPKLIVSSESTISSNRDGSVVSTSTDLSLTPSSARAHPPFFTMCKSLHQLQSIDNQFHSSARKVSRVTSFGKFSDIRDAVKCFKPVETVPSTNSDSSSDISGPESIITSKTNSSGDNENGFEKINTVNFIDFLGVGAN